MAIRTEHFRCVPQLLPENANKVPRLMAQPLPYTYLKFVIPQFNDPMCCMNQEGLKPI
jgi:hypothetical protein